MQVRIMSAAVPQIHRELCKEGQCRSSLMSGNLGRLSWLVLLPRVPFCMTWWCRTASRPTPQSIVYTPIGLSAAPTTGRSAGDVLFVEP